MPRFLRGLDQSRLPPAPLARAIWPQFAIEFGQLSCEELSGHVKPQMWPNRIGRRHETALLDEVLRSDRAELVAVYGRRRVGKTYLVRNHLQPAGTYLEGTGTLDGCAALQRRRFQETLEVPFTDNLALPDLPNWEAALAYLTT